MRILWVKGGKLIPVDTGGKIRSYNLLRQLARRHEVTLLSYYDGPKDSSYESEIVCHFSRAVAVPSGRADSSAIDYLKHLFSHAPYAVTKFTSARATALIREWMAERRFDVAVCDFLSASLNFPEELSLPTVLFQHNVESVLWRRQADYEPNPIKRMAFKLEAAKMIRYEQRAVNRFDHVIAVSENDRENMARMTEKSRISIVPTGVDLEAYRRQPGGDANEPVVVFTGSMDWEANIDGVEYFCAEIWPRVLRAVPGARFRIVGRNPHPRILSLASDSIEVTGTVPSVIDYMRDAAAFAVPLRIGGGTRLKIYEAMAMGKAVVSTSVGAEGLDVEDGRDILLADTAFAFAESVIKLLCDRQARKQIEAAAARLAARFDWSVIADRFEEVLKETIRLSNKSSVSQTAAAMVSA
ncbi:MAG TPA: glycosyltransferase family 4 protein [Blastocatellia bacterium]|nr:glycosyltransferase family 4 protein [Blastocatellia bacterium]